jgi:hypothetical protein
VTFAASFEFRNDSIAIEQSNSVKYSSVVVETKSSLGEDVT